MGQAETHLGVRCKAGRSFEYDSSMSWKQVGGRRGGGKRDKCLQEKTGPFVGLFKQNGAPPLPPDSRACNCPRGFFRQHSLFLRLLRGNVVMFCLLEFPSSDAFLQSGQVFRFLQFCLGEGIPGSCWVMFPKPGARMLLSGSLHLCMILDPELVQRVLWLDLTAIFRV